MQIVIYFTSVEPWFSKNKILHFKINKSLYMEKSREKFILQIIVYLEKIILNINLRCT